MEFEFSNFKKFGAQLQILEKRFPEKVDEFLEETSKTVIRNVKRRTPELSGDLNNHWEVSPIKSKNGTKYIEIKNTAKTTYKGRIVPLAPFVEWGHKITTKSGEVTGKVDGYYMLSTSVKSANRGVPRRLRKLWNELIQE